MTQIHHLATVSAALKPQQAPLPMDADAAAATLIAQLLGNPTLTGTDAAWLALQAEMNALQDGDAATIRRTLARQHVILQALTANLLRQTATLKRAEHVAAVAKAAASVQQADLRTLIALGSIQVKEVGYEPS